MDSNYTSREQIEAYLGDTVSASDAQLQIWINAVKRYITKYTGRVFEAEIAEGQEEYPPEATERLFTGLQSPALLIDDCISVSKVYLGDTYGDSFTEVTDFVTFPLNSTPITKIVLRQNWGVGIHKVKAVWGYSETPPEDIQLASTILVAGIINETSTQTVKSESIGDYSVSYSEAQRGDYLGALTILDGYKKVRL